VHDLAFVRRVVGELAAEGVRTWIFGGWAEELQALAPPRPHRDVDLLYRADGFARVDRLRRDWIGAKRFGHKRAFTLDGTLVELFLVRSDDRGDFTEFWGRRHDWPHDVLAHPELASAAALASYRAAHASLRG